MNSKQLRVTVAAIFALSAYGPRSSGVWAQTDEMAACRAGWEWVRPIQSCSPLTTKTSCCRFFVGAHVWNAYLCRTRIRLGKIRVSLVLCWTLRVVVSVSGSACGRVAARGERSSSDMRRVSFSGSYTIPTLNSTQNYVPPQRESTGDLECDCDTVMYRCALVRVTRPHGSVD